MRDLSRSGSKSKELRRNCSFIPSVIPTFHRTWLIRAFPWPLTLSQSIYFVAYATWQSVVVNSCQHQLIYISKLSTHLGTKCTSTNNDTRIRKCNDSRLQKKKREERPVECRLIHYKCTISISYVDLFKHSTYMCICGGKRMKVIVKSSRLTSSQWKTYKKWK